MIVQTVEDARAAARGGADRLEVVRAIRQGGLTPPIALVRAIAAETDLPLRVILRENAGYATTGRELSAMCRAAGQLAALHIDGLVLGFAHGRDLAFDDLVSVLQAVPDVPATFHRAFDELRDPLRAIDVLGAVAQVDRILTSGGSDATSVRCERLREFALYAGPRLVIMAGGGVSEEVLEQFARMQCVREVHVGRAARDHGDPDGRVSAERVRRLRKLANGERPAEP